MHFSVFFISFLPNFGDFISLHYFLFEDHVFGFIFFGKPYFSIRILTGADASQVMRLLQGITWSGPLQYSPVSSSVIMIPYAYVTQ